MKKLLCVLAIIILMGISNSAYANLLTNGSFETPLQDSTSTGQVPGWFIPTWSLPNMYEMSFLDDGYGVNLANPTNGLALLECFWNGQIYQTVPVSYGQTYQLSFDSWMNNNEGASATFIPKVKLQWLNSSDTVLSTTDVVNLKDLTRRTWVNTSKSYTANIAGTAKARVLIDLYWNAANGSNPPYNPANPTGFDNVNFDVVPEPSSLLLLGTGIIGMLSATRKRKSA